MNIAIKSLDDKVFEEYVTQNIVDIVYLGDETCFYKLESIESLKKKFEIAKQYGKEVFYSLPIIQQSHIKEAQNIIDNIMSWGIKCTFILNDLGMIYFIGTNYKSKDYNVILGRLLSRSGESCPWHEHILRNENEFTKELMYSNSINSNILVDYLRQFKVNGIEGNITSMQKKSLKELKNKGFFLLMNYDYIYVTSSRLCPTAYYLNKEIPHCREFCNTPIELELSQIRDAYSITPRYFDNEPAKNLQGKMSVMGNVVFKENNVCIDIDEIAMYDVIIMDYRRYMNKNKSDISIIINNLKEASRGVWL